MINRTELGDALLKIIEDILINVVAVHEDDLVDYIKDKKVFDGSAVTVNDIIYSKINNKASSAASGKAKTISNNILCHIIDRYGLELKTDDIDKYITADRPLIYIALFIILYGE